MFEIWAIEADGKRVMVRNDVMDRRWPVSWSVEAITVRLFEASRTGTSLFPTRMKSTLEVKVKIGNSKNIHRCTHG
jgi:hypothetical protein